MDDDTGEQGDRPEALVTSSLREDSGGLNERSYAEPQQTESNGDGAAQQCTSISDATNPLHSGSSRFDDQSDAVPQQDVPSSDSVAQHHHTSPSSSTALTQLAHSGSPNKSFLDLPAEIRNMIYCCVFPEGKAAVQLLARHSGKGYIAMSDRLHLLYTCRQIYDEATSLLQAARRFKVVQPRSLWTIIDRSWIGRESCYSADSYLLRLLIPKEGFFFEFDMDRRAVKTNIPALLHINTDIRETCIASVSQFRFHAETNMSKTDPGPDSFDTLQRWLREGPNYLFPLRDVWCNVEIAVILKFKRRDFRRLEGIRFELNGLSDAIVRQSPIRHSLTADLVVQLEHCGTPISAHNKLIVDVLMDALLFLRSVAIEHPELRAEPFPKILMDGRFRVREVHFCLADGTMLELKNAQSFWKFDGAGFWSELCFHNRWDDMVSEGLLDDLGELDRGLPRPKAETINNETLEGGTIELAKRVIN